MKFFHTDLREVLVEMYNSVKDYVKVQMPSLTLTLNDLEGIKVRLLKHTVVVDGHWLWVGGDNGIGYGLAWVEDRLYCVSRLSAYLFLGLDLKSDLQANHKDDICNYTNCWNPEHLYVGTQSKNWSDVIRRTARSTTFKCGHPRTPGNTYKHGRFGDCKMCNVEYHRRKRIKEKINA